MRLWIVVLLGLSCSAETAPAVVDAQGDTGAIDVAPPPLERPVVEMTELGVVTPDPETGLGPLVTFAVPADAVSFLLVADGVRGVTYTFDTLTAPDGTALVPSGWTTISSVPVCLSCRNRVLSERSTVTLLDPIAPVSFIAAGAWQTRLLAYDGSLPPAGTSGPASLRLLVKRAAGPISAGVIDLALQLTASHGLTALAAPGDERLQGAIERVRAILGPVGLTIGAVTYHDVSSELQVIDADELEDLFAARKGPDESIAIFLVSLLTAGGTPLLGLTAVPGPAGPKTLRSGVALSSDPDIDVPLGGDPLGPAMAHEVGHYLGLFHTRELKGTIYDPIEDTPEQSHDGLMTPDLRGTALTPQQGAVMRGHPLVR